MDGDNSLEVCWEVTTRTLHETFAALYDHGIDLQGALLKPNMVVPGKGSPDQASSERIAEATVNTFLGVVPAAIPGIVFLSGGQSEVEATANLNAINQLGGPWPLSFSYGRALAGLGAPGVGRRHRQHGGCAGRVRPSRSHERARGRGRVERGDGAAGRRVGRGSPRPCRP